MFGIRIPTEGHQSMFIAKVVGVLNNGASQAIVPEHLVTRTGWDYDIDSIYLSMKEFDVIDGQYIEYTKMIMILINVNLWNTFLMFTLVKLKMHLKCISERKDSIS